MTLLLLPFQRRRSGVAKVSGSSLSSCSLMSRRLTERVLQMGKKCWKGRQMSDVAYVEQAVRWSKELTRLRSRQPGDLENAMRSVARDTGVDYWTLWQLRYRSNRLKDIGVGIYTRLHAAYLAECERQEAKLRHEREITKATGGIAQILVSAADALAGQDLGTE